MNMGLSKTCNWCNDRFLLPHAHMLLPNIKSFALPNNKRKNMLFCCVASPFKELPTVPSAQTSCQDIRDSRLISKRCLKRTATQSQRNSQIDENPQPSKKQAPNVEPPTPKPSPMQMPQPSPVVIPADPPESFSNRHSTFCFLLGTQRTQS